jgi:hypothetical protein
VITDQPSTIFWNLIREEDSGGGHCIRIRSYEGPSVENYGV